MAEIPLTGIADNFIVPGQYAEILFAQGPASVALGARVVCLVMPMTAAGTWTAGELYGPLKSTGEASDGAGIGSPAHRAAKIFITANPGAKLFILPYAETVGGSPAKATATVTWVTDPTDSGATTITLCGEAIKTVFSSSDTITTIAEAQVLAINAREHLPVTAANVAGVLTVTAKINGISQGDGTTGVLRIRASIDSGIGTSVTASGAALGLGTGAPGAEGTTTEAAQFALALANLTAIRKYYIGSSLWDATSLQSLALHVSTKSLPISGLRSVAVAAYTGALAAAQTLATARNYERLQIVWQPNSEHDPAELVGNMLAIRQQKEQLYAAFNFDSYRGVNWLIAPVASAADHMDPDDLNDALNDGLTPLQSDGTGSYVVSSMTTRSKNQAGTVADSRASESHRISVADQWTDQLLADISLTFGAQSLKDDERDADGNINFNQKQQKDVIRPSRVRGFLAKALDDGDDDRLLQEVAKSKAAIAVVKTGGRIESGVDLHIIDLAHQFTFRIAEVSGS